jgi:hypothetical protein
LWDSPAYLAHIQLVKKSHLDTAFVTIAANVCQGQQILDGRNSALHVHSNTVRVNFFHTVVTFVMHVTDFSTGLTVVQKYIQSQGTVLMNKPTMPKNIS